MSPPLFRSLLIALALLPAWLPSQPVGDLTFDSAANGLAIFRKQLDPSQTKSFSATNYDAISGLGKLQSQSDTGDSIRVLTNRVTTANGGYRLTTYFLEGRNQLFATRTIQNIKYSGGPSGYSDEIETFRDGQLIATVGRRGDYEGSLDDAELQEYAVPASEIESFAAPQIYRQNLREALLIEGLVNAFGSRLAGEIPTHPLLRTLSPNGRYIVTWEEKEADAEYVLFNLFDLVEERVMTQINEGRVPGDNHVYHTSHWGPESELFTFVSDAKWNTVSAPLLKIPAKNGEVTELGNLHELAIHYAMQELQAIQHPYLQKSPGPIDGFVKVLALIPDGRVHLILDAQSKSEDPYASIRCEMTLQFVADQEVELLGFGVLDPEQSAGAPAFPGGAESSKELEWTITASRVGPVDATTPAEPAAIEPLFPAHRVVAATEFFEEGGEQSVVQVLDGDNLLLMVVPRLGTTAIRWIQTAHPAFKTRQGAHAGQRFGDLFESLPETALFEGMTGEVVVAAPDLPNVTLRFLPLDPASDQSSELPDYERLADWTLDRIEWMAPAE